MDQTLIARRRLGRMQVSIRKRTATRELRDGCLNIVTRGQRPGRVGKMLHGRVSLGRRRCGLGRQGVA